MPVLHREDWRAIGERLMKACEIKSELQLAELPAPADRPGRPNWISDTQLEELAAKFKDNSCGRYLLELLRAR